VKHVPLFAQAGVQVADVGTEVNTGKYFEEQLFIVLFIEFLPHW
jgi:hypothetical protein